MTTSPIPSRAGTEELANDKNSVRSEDVAQPYLTSWCGGLEGNSQCNYNCKLCLILTGKAELINADDNTHKLTYRIKEEA